MRPTSFSLWTASIVLCCVSSLAEEAPKGIPAPSVDNPRAAGDSQTAVLAGGCYWGMQYVFEHVKGVTSVVAGFSGPGGDGSGDDFIGRGQQPAEAVQIRFDPGQISYGQLLQIFFSVAHDPTQLNRQGPDRGQQYRSEIFAADDTQQRIAESYIAQLQRTNIFTAPIVTVVDRSRGFTRVSAPQQDYVEKHLTSAYVVTFDIPKLPALKQLFSDIYADQAGGPARL